VHPIERLRYVARAGGFNQTDLTREAADALASLWGEPADLVNACRRMLSHHPLAGTLWVMAAKVLISMDARTAAFDFIKELETDRTSQNIVSSLPEQATIAVVGWPDLALAEIHKRQDICVRVIDAYGEGAGLARALMQRDVRVEEVPLTGLGQACATSDVVILEASVAGPTSFVAPSGSHAAAVCGMHSEKEVWVAVGHGRSLPKNLFSVVEHALNQENSLEADDELVALADVSHTVGPKDLRESEIPLREDCAEMAELMRFGI